MNKLFQKHLFMTKISRKKQGVVQILFIYEQSPKFLCIFLFEEFFQHNHQKYSMEKQYNAPFDPSATS